MFTIWGFPRSDRIGSHIVSYDLFTINIVSKDRKYQKILVNFDTKLDQNRVVFEIVGDQIFQTNLQNL